MTHLDLKKNLTWVPLLLIVYNFTANLANDIYLPSMPKLAAQFTVSSNDLQLTMTAWFAGIALPQLFFGPLTDRFGRKPIIMGGGICFLIGTFVCALSTHLSLLIAGRFFQGVGVCSLNVTTFAILADLYNRRERSPIINKITFSQNLAPLLGPILGGFILTNLHWRVNFLLILILGSVCLAGLSKKLPESNQTKTILSFKIIFTNYFKIICNKYYIVNLFVYCSLLAGLIAYLTASPFVMIKQMNFSPETFGIAQVPIFGSFMLGSFILSRVKHEIPGITLYGVIIASIFSFFMLVLSLFFKDQWIIFILPMSFYAFGFGLSAGQLINEIMSCEPNHKGLASSLLGLMMAISCFFSSLTVSIFYNGHIQSVAIWIVLFVFFGASIYYFFSAKSYVIKQDELSS